MSLVQAANHQLHRLDCTVRTFRDLAQIKVTAASQHCLVNLPQALD